MLFWKAEEKLWDADVLEKGEIVLKSFGLCCETGVCHMQSVIL